MSILPNHKPSRRLHLLVRIGVQKRIGPFLPQIMEQIVRQECVVIEISQRKGNDKVATMNQAITKAALHTLRVAIWKNHMSVKRVNPRRPWSLSGSMSGSVVYWSKSRSKSKIWSVSVSQTTSKLQVVSFSEPRTRNRMCSMSS